MPYPTTVIFTIIAVILYLLLTMLVVRLRHQSAIGLGDGGNVDLQRAIRAHGNFAEYVPLGLFMLLLLESSLGSSMAESFGILLIVGRVFHIYSILVHEPKTGSYTLRIAGTLTTLGTFAFGAFLLFQGWMRVHGM